MTILDSIIQDKKAEISNSKSLISIDELREKPFFSRPTFSLKETMKSRTGIIAEFKRKSPSKGIINDIANPVSVGKAYEKFGASAMSILTDYPYFGGTSEDLVNVRPHINIPILRKDFMIDAYQFYEAKALGADVILLIAACLSPFQVEEFTELSHELNLEVLLEIHSEEELKHVNSKIDFVGINNRNLKDFKVNLQHSIDLKNKLPEGILSVAESGIYNETDFRFLKEQGFDGFLMGEYFMKAYSPEEQFETFIQNTQF